MLAWHVRILLQEVCRVDQTESSQLSLVISIALSPFKGRTEYCDLHNYVCCFYRDVHHFLPEWAVGLRSV